MPVTLPLEVYETLETGFGKEGARKVVKALEATISDAIDYRWATTKEELLDSIRKEFVTRQLFEERINSLRLELLGKIDALYEKTEKDKTELLGRMEKDKEEILGRIEKDRTELLGRMEKHRAEIEGEIARLDQKFNFMIILLIIALTLMNPVAAEIMKRLLKM